jgi:hypothetical protein
MAANPKAVEGIIIETFVILCQYNSQIHRVPAGRIVTNKQTNPRLYSKVWPMLSIFDSNKQKTPLEISVVFDRWGAVL